MSIILEDISFSYNEEGGKWLNIIKSLSLSLPTNKVIAIAGLSGSGKSTILKLICGLLSPDNGNVKINGATPENIQKQGNFGLVFQSPELLPWRNLFNNVILPFELQKRNFDKDGVLKIIADLELTHAINKYPHELSGGMQQRTALVRALVSKPPFLLLDEPFSQLDEIIRFNILLYLQDYALKNNTTVIIVTHDITEAVLVADSVFILSQPPVSSLIEVPVKIEKPRNFETISSSIFYGTVELVRNHLKRIKEESKWE